MFEELLKAAVGVVVAPVSLAADLVTLGGTLSDKQSSYTAETVSRIIDNLDKATK